MTFEARLLMEPYIIENYSKYIDMDKLYKSDIDFGLVTYSVKNKTPLKAFKNDIPKEQLH